MEKYKIMLQRHDVEVQRRLTSLHHPTSQRHLELFAKIFRIKMKIREKRRRDDKRTRRGEKAKNRIITEFLCLIYSFPIFFFLL